MSFGPFTSPTPVWSSYVDLDEFKRYVQYPQTQVDDDDELRLIVDSSCSWAQDWLARPIAPTEFSRRFDGWTSWMGSFIVLPYAPVLQVVNVTEWWGLSGPHVLTEQTPANQNPKGNQGMYQLEPITGIVRRTFAGLVQRPWFPGSRNIEITWIAGYNPIPSQIRLATLELAAYWYRSTQEAPRMASPRPYGEGEPRNDLWPAVPSRVTALLESYVQQGIG